MILKVIDKQVLLASLHQSLAIAQAQKTSKVWQAKLEQTIAALESDERIEITNLSNK